MIIVAMDWLSDSFEKKRKREKERERERKLLQSKTGPVLGSVSPVDKSQPARVVKSRPIATSSSKGDPKCGLEPCRINLHLTTYAGTWFQSVV